MSHQMEEGWYPECDGCGCGNLAAGAITLCKECKKKYLKRKALEELV